MRKLLLLCAVCILLVFPVVANATPIAAALTGIRSTAIGDITATDGWSGTGNAGFKISWDITPNGVGDTLLYHYQYTISGAGNNNLGKGLSHWILEVTEPSNADDFTMTAVTAVDSYYGALPTPSSIPFTGPVTFTGTGDSGSNPYMPSPVYGIKLDTDSILTDPDDGDGEELDIVKFVINFTSAKDPVWGDFYAKDGFENASGVFATAYNVGFYGPGPGSATTDFTAWIARPNGGGGGGDDSVPEPATMLLLGSGLIGLAVTGKKKFKRRNG